MITTLCYLRKNNEFLMLHRTKKKQDVNAGKWIGVGGKLEAGETPYQAMIREIEEETGYLPEQCEFRGIVVFCYNDNPPEKMYLYTCDRFSGEMRECPEGDLKWIPEEDLFDLNLWEGDKIFIELIRTESAPFHLTLMYHDDALIDHVLRPFSISGGENIGRENAG